MHNYAEIENILRSWRKEALISKIKPTMVDKYLRKPLVYFIIDKTLNLYTQHPAYFSGYNNLNQSLYKKYEKRFNEIGLHVEIKRLYYLI